jgi:pyridoxal phosphate enzyme (YggS family)
MSVTENITRIRESFGSHSIKLIAVTKNAHTKQIEEAFKSGVTEFGESRVQDALPKMNAMPDWLNEKASWHFIGHLQGNKVKQVVGAFSLIHSVDSLRLAKEISRVAEMKNIKQPVLLQVKMTPDANKFGFEPSEIKSCIGEIVKLSGIDCKGLMTITPENASGDVRQKCFIGLKQLRDELAEQTGVYLPELSMGMSDDWKEAITCGSTMLRIGRAIFHV